MVFHSDLAPRPQRVDVMICMSSYATLDIPLPVTLQNFLSGGCRPTQSISSGRAWDGYKQMSRLEKYWACSL